MGWAKYAEDNYEISLERVYMKKRNSQFLINDSRSVCSQFNNIPNNISKVNQANIKKVCSRADESKNYVFYTADDFWKLVNEKQIKTSFKQEKHCSNYNRKSTSSVYMAI